MIFLLAALISILFVELLIRSGFLKTASQLFATSNQAGRVVTSSRISDHWKEKALLAYSGRLMLYTLKLALVLAVAAGVVWLAGWAAQYYLDIDLLDFLATWQGILLCTAVGVVYAFLFYRGRGKATPDAGESDYSTSAKLLHRVALASPAIREMSFDIEIAAGGKTTTAQTADRPHIFVAGLARAGTTILMRSLYACGRYRSLTYRDMPFVLMPNLWRRISGVGARQKAEQERAHGDGIAVNYDSPEALEEVFWKTFSGKDYLYATHLEPHSPDAETQQKFVTYVDAIIRASEQPQQLSYLSKNNNNILRLPTIAASFPSARIIVPFRDPLQQSLSLRRQHWRFVEDDKADEFTGKYMTWLAHHEFGANRRPFCFQEQAKSVFEQHDPDKLEHWLLLWTHVYQNLLQTAPANTVFLSYEKLCEDDKQTWHRLLEHLDLTWPQSTDQVFRLSQSSLDETPDTAILSQAREVHEQLLARCL